eukprot:4337788-Heterocapsa_arctica.AAC.1
MRAARMHRASCGKHPVPDVGACIRARPAPARPQACRNARKRRQRSRAASAALCDASPPAPLVRGRSDCHRAEACGRGAGSRRPCRQDNHVRDASSKTRQASS